MRATAGITALCLVVVTQNACSTQHAVQPQDAGIDGPPAEPWVGTEDLFGLWAASRSDAWAVGVGGVTVHWDGHVWASIPSGTTAVLGGVWGSASTDVWAVGTESAILHWNGVGWSPVPSGADRGIYRVGGRSANDVWAVCGPFGVGIPFLHWEGSTWTGVPSGGTSSSPEEPSDVWVSSAGDVWTAAWSLYRSRWDVWRWDALSGWWRTELSLPFPQQGVDTVWGSGPDDVWAAGGAEGVGLIVRLRGQGGDFTGGRTLNRIRGSGPRDIWAVGYGGTIFRWDGFIWEPADSGTTEDLHDAWATAPDNAWAVGTNGTILHWDGLAWASAR